MSPRLRVLQKELSFGRWSITRILDKDWLALGPLQVMSITSIYLRRTHRGNNKCIREKPMLSKAAGVLKDSINLL